MCVPEEKPEEKRCTKCGELLPLGTFPIRTYRSGKKAAHSHCRKCLAGYAIRHSRKPEAKATRQRYYTSGTGRWLYAEAALRSAYGIDGHDWALMYERQRGTCAGCDGKLRFDRTTHVDHCHKTGKVRGLLCVRCNNTLGRTEDDPAVLRRLAAYLEAV